MRTILKHIAGAFRGRTTAVPAPSIDASSFLAEVRDAIDAASISLRAADDDGPRVLVMSRTLRGMFHYSREEAARRIRLAFPELSEQAVTRAARHLENRVILTLRPRVQAARKRSSWVHGWKDETSEGFR